MRFLRWERNQDLELLHETWEISLDEIPDQGMLDISVFVYQHISLRHDPTPRDLGVRLLKGWTDPVRRLSDDLNRALDR